jgi:hypothetical protein
MEGVSSMAGDTIVVRYEALQSAIARLNALYELLQEGQEDFSMGHKGLINYSSADTFDSVNRAFAELQAAENAFRELVDLTRQVMINAGISFSEAEDDIMAMLQRIS